MLSANFKPKRIAAASRGFLATARLSCIQYDCNEILSRSMFTALQNIGLALLSQAECIVATAGQLFVSEKARV